MKKILKSMLLSVTLLAFTTQVALAQGKIFTAQELSTYNGQNGAKSYTSYKGVVYDVTDSKLWKLGEHFGLKAGYDLTADMVEAPHGDEVFSGFEIVGNLEGFVVDKDINPISPEPAGDTDIKDEMEQVSPVKTDSTPWYAKRIRLAGFSILGWTGIVLGIFFILTFATCFALPWAKLPLPWKGSKIGPDPLDESNTHMKWSSIHKYFVWVTVIFGIIHGIIGFLQMFGIYL